jgi:hypothetical protein
MPGTQDLGTALGDADAGRITYEQLLEILQEAIDNGDILLEQNELLTTSILPLLDRGQLTRSGHVDEYEARMSRRLLDRLGNTEPSEAGSGSEGHSDSRKASALETRRLQIAAGLVVLILLSWDWLASLTIAAPLIFAAAILFWLFAPFWLSDSSEGPSEIEKITARLRELRAREAGGEQVDREEWREIGARMKKAGLVDR